MVTEVAVMRERLARLEAEQRRTRRLTIVGAAVFAASVWALPVAFSAPPAPAPCEHSDLYCFEPGQPARASEVNSNFETLHDATDALHETTDVLHDVTDGLTSGLAAVSGDVATRLPLSGGSITGSLEVQGNLSVGSGLPITVTDQYVTSSAGNESVTTMTPFGRSVCFLVGVNANLTGNHISPFCHIRPSNNHWILNVVRREGSSGFFQCVARCISW